jgi:hypothetical protein
MSSSGRKVSRIFFGIGDPRLYTGHPAGELEEPLLVHRCKAYEARGRAKEAAADRKLALRRDKQAFKVWGDKL